MSFQLAKAIYPTVNSDSPESYLHGNKTKALYSIVDGLAHLPEPQDFDKEDRRLGGAFVRVISVCE